MRVFILMMCVCGALTVPLRQPDSGRICQEGVGRFLPNKRYTYRYVGTTATGIMGTTHNTTGLKIQALCQVDFLGRECKHVLRIRDVKLLERSSKDPDWTVSSGEKDFKKALESNNLMFTVSNGRISSIMPFVDEPVFVSNIKRGILSTLQLQITDETETTGPEVDVTGECWTSIKRLRENETSVEFMKKKNLTNCTSRADKNTWSMKPVVYESNSDIKTLFNSTNVCRYVVEKRGTIKTVECTEIHLFRPFSHRTAGVTTNVTQNMTLERVGRTFVSSDFWEDDSQQKRTTSLLYEHTSKQDSRPVYEDDTSVVHQLLKEMVTSTPTNETTLMAAANFTTLVFSVRKLNADSVMALLRRYLICESCSSEDHKKYKQFLFDALTQCGTEPCMTQIFKIVRDEEDTVTPGEVALLMSAMSWVRKPTEKMFRQVLDLLRNKDTLPRSTRLYLGNMINKYCTNAPNDCRKDSTTTTMEAVDWLESQLPNECRATPETVNDVMVTLRALGNARRTRKAIRLVQCALDSNYNNISMIAMETVRCMEYCDVTWSALLQDVYGVYSLDPELRIQAYLTLMKYPTEKMIRQVATVLDKEVNSQVGALVCSHLTHMNESVEPTYGITLNRMIKTVLANRERPLCKFNTTSKSRFWQKSFFSEEQNFGVSTDGHVIYHPESMWPRDVAFNMTVDIWGGAFPVLETKAHMEGLELIWEKLFGPKGYFPDNHVLGLMQTHKEQRERRSTDNTIDLEEFDAKVNLKTLTPSAFMSLELFGNELDMFSMEDFEWLEEDEIPIANIIAILRRLSKGVKKTYTKSVVFLQESYVVPTCLGVPLNLSLNGTAVGSLHVEGKADLLSLFWGPKRAVVKGTIKPSSVIMLSGQMSVDAIHASNGILMNGSIFTSTQLEGNVTYTEAEGVKVHFNVTDRPQQILNISTALFHHSNQKKTPITGVTRRNTTSLCSTDLFNSTDILGIDICQNISIPLAWDNNTTPYFPLTGPTNYSLTLSKTDHKLTVVRIESNFTKTNDNTNKTCVTFSTPSASSERKYYVNVTTHRSDKQSRWNVSVGADDDNATTFDYIYTGRTHGVNVTLNFTRNASFAYFHRKCAVTKKLKVIGIGMHVTLWNHTIQHISMAVNHTNDTRYQLLTNTTVLNSTSQIPMTVLFLNTSISYHGNTTGNLTLNMTHRPWNFTWFVQGRHSMRDLSTNVTCNMSCPLNTTVCNHSLTVNVTYLNSTNVKGARINATLSGTRIFNGSFVEISKRNTTTFVATFTVLNRTTALNMTMTNTTDVKGWHLDVTHQNTSVTLNATWAYSPEMKNVSLKIAYLNHTMLLSSSIGNTTWEKGICLNATYLNGSRANYTLLATCVSFVNATQQKHLVFNVTTFNRSTTVNTTWFATKRGRGVAVNCKHQNRTVFNMTVVFSNSTTTKRLNLNATLGNWTVELNHTYFSTEGRPELEPIRSINITHKIKNGTVTVVNNTFGFTFYNATNKKGVVVNVTLWNVTYGSQVMYVNRTKPGTLWHTMKMLVYMPNKTMSWQGVYKNSTETVNFTSLLEYEPTRVLNHSILWNKKMQHLNISLDIHQNVSVTFNCSGHFSTAIDITANVTVLNQSLVWSAFISNRTLVSNLTMWNRSLALVSRTCNVSNSVFLNLSSWHNYDKTAWNASFVWLLNATERVTHLNVTVSNVTLNLVGFSYNASHLNVTLTRRNGSEVYNESSLEFSGNKLYQTYNMTTLRTVWGALNRMTRNITGKVANITLNATAAGGVNISAIGLHLKFLLRNVTQELVHWNYTTETVTENLFNLTQRLLNVTSHCLPTVTANYTVFFPNNNTMNLSLFWNNLATLVVNISRSNISAENVTEEILVILRNFTNNINATAFFGNITHIITKTAFYNATIRNVTEGLVANFVNFTEFSRNVTRNLTSWLNSTAVEIGNWTLLNSTIDQCLKDFIPVWRNLTLKLLTGTVNTTTYLRHATLALRDATRNVTEYFLNVTHPVLYNMAWTLRRNISMYVDKTSFVGGVIYPALENFTQEWNTSLLNLTMTMLHNLTVCNSSLEWLIPSLHFPANISQALHFTTNMTLLEKLEKLLNKSLEFYNATCRVPAYHMNRTYNLLVNYTDAIVTLLNDTVNILDVTTNKTLAEIGNMYINQTRNMTMTLWNITVELISSNLSKPLMNETWQKMNLTRLYFNWTYGMPWSRPVIKKWNNTMFKMASTMRNCTQFYLPRFINITSNMTAKVVYAVNTTLSMLEHTVNMTVRNNTMNCTAVIPENMKLNFTTFFNNISYFCQNWTRPALNFTRNTTERFLNATRDWTTAALYGTWNMTGAVLNFNTLNTTIRFVNGSLVNETVFSEYMRLSDYYYFTTLHFSMNITRHILNRTVSSVNKSVTQMIHGTMSPFLTSFSNVKKLLEFEAEEIVELLVPQNETAMMFGRHNFYSFDKRYFRFPGFQKKGCLYLVARDFKDGNFTIMADGESIIILTSDAQMRIYRSGVVMSVGSSGKVVNELPVQFGKTTVERDGPYILVKSDIDVECDMQHFVCSYTISGFYHNRTAGLLGTNNGEPSDDWLTPSGKNRTLVHKFVNSWEVRGDKECTVDKDMEKNRITKCGRMPSTRCRELFLDTNSILRECFAKVNPRDFFSACQADVIDCETQTPTERSHCNATAAYVKECSRRNVMLQMPSDCITCKVDKRIYKENETWTERPSREVDVVLVCSEGAKMRSIAQDLPLFVNILDKSLRLEGWSVRFGLVGFSGKAPVHRPGHVHTIKGNFFESGEEFKHGVNNMEFTPEDEKSNVSDGYSGLAKVVQYPFRPGASKLVILITDSVRVADSPLDTHTVTEMLKNNGVRMVAIGDYKFKKMMISADSENRRYYKSYPKGIRHETAERLPSYDEYVKVMMKTGGAIVSVERFKGALRSPTKPTMTIVINTIQNQMRSDPNHCKLCICTSDQVGTGRTVCTNAPSCK